MDKSNCPLDYQDEEFESPLKLPLEGYPSYIKGMRKLKLNKVLAGSTVEENTVELLCLQTVVL